MQEKVEKPIVSLTDLVKKLAMADETIEAYLDVRDGGVLLLPLLEANDWMPADTYDRLYTEIHEGLGDRYHRLPGLSELEAAHVAQDRARLREAAIAILKAWGLPWREDA